MPGYMFNYKILIRYDGSAYSGWQIQKNAATVQELISSAIQTIVKSSVNLTGAGRTDAGVHSIGQTANFLVEKELDLYLFVHQLNGILPRDIAVIKAEQVPESFNARYSAKSRTYRYLFTTKKNPFLRGKALFFPRKLDVNALRTLSAPLFSQHDFRAFAKELPENGNCVCDVKALNWARREDIVVFTIRADRFLHGMVRHIAGTLIHAQENGLDADAITAFLEPSAQVKTPYALPPDGLYLLHVEY